MDVKAKYCDVEIVFLSLIDKLGRMSHVSFTPLEVTRRPADCGGHCCPRRLGGVRCELTGCVRRRWAEEEDVLDRRTPGRASGVYPSHGPECRICTPSDPKAGRATRCNTVGCPTRKRLQDAERDAAQIRFLASTTSPSGQKIESCFY